MGRRGRSWRRGGMVWEGVGRWRNLSRGRRGRRSTQSRISGTMYEAVQDLTPEVVPQCCTNSSSDIIQAEKKSEKVLINYALIAF